MNANPKFLNATASVDEAAVQPLPNSRKIYVEGSRSDVRVPMREITQSDTPASFGAEKNPALAVYDTSGPYTDPAATIDIRKGLLPLRAAWIAERADTVELAGPTSTYGQARLADPELAGFRFDLHRKPRRAKPGTNVTQMPYARRGNARTHGDTEASRPPRHRHAGDGIHRDPREPAARGDARALPRERAQAA